MRRKLFTATVVAIIAVFIAGGWAMLISQGKKDMTASGNQGLIRFHVVANSDSNQDQAVKLKVRDAIVEYLTPQLEKSSSIDESRKIIAEHKKDLIAIAQQIVAQNGGGYPVDLQIGWFDFPVKSYGTLVLPAGKYEAVRILLGKAEGKNWWCVLFPPLCFIDAANATAVPVMGNQANNEQAPDNDNKVEFRFKIAELFK